MRKIILFGLLSLICRYSAAQLDTLEFSNRLEAGDYLFGLLDPQGYDGALLNKSMSTDPILAEQIRGKKNQTFTTVDWANLFSEISISYSDTTLFPTIPEFWQRIEDFFFYHDYNYSELYQPFALTLQNVSYIDTTLVYGQDFQDNDGQVYALIEDSLLYKKALIEAASILEFYPDNGYTSGYLKYDENFILCSEDIVLKQIQIDIGDGNGFQIFDDKNNLIEYDRMVDSTIAVAKVQYDLDGVEHEDLLSFYLTTYSNNSLDKSNYDIWDDAWLDFDALPGNDLKYDVGIKYGCGNGNKIRRPIIISCAYRPVVQPFSLNKYWNQFNIGGLYDAYTAQGYDILFIKDKPGNKSLQEAGDELAEFIKYVNNLKAQNWPGEDWENVVQGYSMGGQKARYALLKMEKEHMENGGPHHHTRLYIPFDSPHHGVNIALHAQSVYRHFKLTNLLALGANNSLVDEASSDMGLYSVYESTELSNSNLFHKKFSAEPTQDHLDFQNEVKNDFIHQYSHPNDTRRSFPSFTRNIAVATASYNNNYQTVWGMTPGMELFKQNGPGGFVTPLSWHFGFISRKLWASEYSNTEIKPAFNRFDSYVGTTWWGFPLVVVIKKKFSFKNQYELDLAQGGYKTQFYDVWPTGAVNILQTGGAFLGNKIYDDEMSFLPIFSSLAINHNEWANNNLYYNLQDEDLMIVGFDQLTGDEIVSETYGYPNLGHPNTHFQITPFESIFADEFNWDHIVFKETLEDHLDTNETYYDPYRDYLADEIEGWDMPLQNKVIGENHNPTVLPKYKAWYKARQSVVIGREVTVKTDPGDFIIQSTGDITVHANESVVIKEGFHAQAGCVFKAYINDDCDLYQPSTMNLNESSQTVATPAKEREKKDQQEVSKEELRNSSYKIYPNPTAGNITVEFSELNDFAVISVYTSDGQLVKRLTVDQLINKFDLDLNKGLYLLTLLNGEKMTTERLIIE